jgi:hypothetical protein
MSALLEAYEHPTGEIDPENAAAVASQVAAATMSAREQDPLKLMNELVDELQSMGGVQPTDAGMEDAGPADSNAAITILGQPVDVGASARLHHICDGWQDTDPDAGTAGSAELTVAADGRGFLSTVWGTLDACRVRQDTAALELTGALQVHFGGAEDRVTPSQLKEVGYLVSFDGRISVEMDSQRVERSVRFDFRVFPPAELQLNVVQSDGTNVVAVLDAGSLIASAQAGALSMQLRTRDTTWRCDFHVITAHGTCHDSLDEARQVSW